MEEEGTRWALLYNDTTDCIFPQFCYSSYVKKISSFFTFDTVVFQWVMSLSSVRIVASITGGCSSCRPLGRLVRRSWDSWHFSLRRTDGHADTHTHLPMSSFTHSFSLLFFPLLVGLENFSRRYFFPPRGGHCPAAASAVASCKRWVGEAAKPCHEEFEQLRGDQIDMRAFLQQCRIALTPHPNNQE